jgi:hypothetical protein
MAGGKVNKARITANFCCNASGTDKLPIWFIGTAAKPRCFAATDTDITNLPMVWRSNKKGWMNAQLFREWLYWFDAHMEGKKVALLIDNFSAHESGLEIVKNEGGLKNVEVIFLPVNATSYCQPLDQGIIRSWKAHYPGCNSWSMSIQQSATQTRQCTSYKQHYGALQLGRKMLRKGQFPTAGFRPVSSVQIIAL